MITIIIITIIIIYIYIYIYIYIWKPLDFVPCFLAGIPDDESGAQRRNPRHHRGILRVWGISGLEFRFRVQGFGFMGSGCRDSGFRLYKV